MKSLFVVFAFFLVAGCDAFAAGKFDSRSIRQDVADRLEDGYLHGLAFDAFDSMFAKAQVELKKKGRADLAAKLSDEWQDFGQDLLAAMASGAVGDVGDHEPFNQWVAEWYAKLEAILGVQIMELTHLRDIWVLSYTLPVVFRPSVDSAWCLEVPEDDTCQDEYRRHLAGTKWQRKPDENADAVQHHGFAGVVTYWAVWAGCTAATSGAGSLLCGPAGTGAEFVMERYFAPGISDRIFLRVNADHLAADCHCCDCGCDSCEDCDCDDCECPDCDHGEGDEA